MIVEKMVRILRRLFGCTTATAAVEAAIFAPIFLTLTLGVTDLGSGMFVRMTVNAAAQAGAAYAVTNSGCATLTSTCLSGIKTAMNDATGNSSFCTVSAQNPNPCTASITSCADGSPKCIIVAANYSFTPILADAVYSWAKLVTVSSTVTIRVQ
jgi:Flp pilus assembly protein TadG